MIFGKPLVCHCIKYDSFSNSFGMREKWPVLDPRGVLPNKKVGVAWTSHQVWRQNLGQGPAKFTK